MADFDKIEISATLNIPDATSQIQSDLLKVQANLKPITISANINSDAIKQQTQQIQSQLNSVVSQFKNENIDFGANLDTTKIQKSGQTIQEVSDKVAILAQQMQILQARAENAGISLNQIQVDKFTNLLNNFKIPEATTELKELRNEYSLLNVEMSKQLPENAIENMATSAKNLEAQIGTIESKFSTISLGNSSNWSSQVQSVDANVQQLRANLDAFNNAQMGQDKVQAFNTLNSSVKETKTQVENLTKSQKALAGVDITSNKLEAYLNDNEKVAAKFPNEVNAIKASLQSLGNETDTTKLTTGLQNANKQFTDLRSEAQAAGAEGRTIFGQLGNDIGKFAQWTISATVLMSAINGVKNAISDVVDLNTKLTQTAEAMSTSVSNLGQLATSAQSIATSMGASVSDVLDIAHIYANEQTSLSETIEHTKSAVELMNISGLSSSESSDALQGVQQAFGITADKLEHVNDVMATLASNVKINYQTAIQDMSQAISTAGTAAHESGMSLEEYLAVTVKAAETTRQTGDTIATAEKTIFARVGQSKTAISELGTTSEDISNAAKALKSTANVDVMDKQTGKMRDMQDILSDLSKKWDGLSRANQNYVAYAASGKMYA